MTRKEIIVLVLLTLMSVFLYADQNVINPLIMELQQEYGVTKDKIGLIASSFFILGALVSLVLGYYTDKVSRKKLIVITVLLGEIPCLLTGFPYFTRTYGSLFFLRILTGIGLGGLFPLTFSLIGDYFKGEHRAIANAWVGLAWVIGQLLGQTVAGYTGIGNWRLPFILVAVPNFILLAIFMLVFKEPKRGAAEDALQVVFDQGGEYTATIKPSDLGKLFKVPTNMLAFLQGIPGTIPWGILPFFLVDFYRQAKGFDAEVATTLMLIYGMGATMGEIMGGYIGAAVYKRNPILLPILCGLTIILGVLPWYWMINMQFRPEPGWADSVLPSFIGFFGGVIATFASANIKALLMAVNPPENRGSAFAIFNLTDNIGKGLGPWVGGLLIRLMGYAATLQMAVTWWIPSGIIFLMIAYTIRKDKAKMEAYLLKKVREQYNELT